MARRCGLQMEEWQIGKNISKNLICTITILQETEQI